jgi:membrane protein implicated in regulation of membrane protease activity
METPPTQGTEDGSGRQPAAGQNGRHPGTDAVHRLSQGINELREYAAYYVMARSDAIRASVRKTGLYAVVGVIAAVLGCAILATGGVLLMLGLAGGISQWLGAGPWLGQLVVGFIIPAIVLAAAVFFVKRALGKSRQRTIQRYEQRQNQQRERFGHDVHDVGAESAASK